MEAQLFRRRNMAPIQGRNYRAGEWVPARGNTFPSTNPADVKETIGVFPTTSPADVQAAVAAARSVYPMWRRTSRIHRAEHFDRLAQLVKRDTDALAEL